MLAGDFGYQLDEHCLWVKQTLCDIAGLPKPKHLQGRSLKLILDDPRTKGKQVAIDTMISPHTKQRGHTLRTDADELHNLAKQPSQAERMIRMRQRLAANLKSVVGGGRLRVSRSPQSLK